MYNIATIKLVVKLNLYKVIAELLNTIAEIILKNAVTNNCINTKNL